MSKRILFVDDDDKILKMFKRSLAKDFEVHVALGPEEGLKQIAEEDAFCVVVSDLKMPGMDGITFLNKVRKLAPETVRVILTGYADLENAMASVNTGGVFRFLTKPCEMGAITDVLKTCVKQFELVTAEKVLLERTLKGCIEVLSESLSLVNPEAFGKATRVSRFVRMLTQKMDIKNIWKYEVAAMLSQIGCMVLPESAIVKLNTGKPFSPEEVQLYDMHPSIGRNLISHIPRMEAVAEMVHYQNKNFDGTGTPVNSVEGADIPLGGRLLKVAGDFDLAYTRTGSWSKAFLSLENKLERYDPEIMYYLEGCLGSEARYEKGLVRVRELLPGMIVQQSVEAKTGPLLLRKGKELSAMVITKLLTVHERIGVKEPIEVYIPVEFSGGVEASSTTKE
ncbi:MAG: response regulator [Proteobacteria bacterium]|nr:response regulator [Pseudomonadota bacterium]MBU1611197.1 response regulator [Pseudomonadota bacterium]